MKIPIFPEDKANHFIYGFVIYLVAGLLFSGLTALYAVVFVAIAKEIIWDKLFKKGNPELLDIVFTIIPGLILEFLKHQK